MKQQQSSINNNNNNTYLWDMKINQLSSWLESEFLPTVDDDRYHFTQQHEGIRTVLLRNLCVALEATKAVPTKDKNDTILYYSLQDPYRIWFEVDSVWDTLSHPLPLNPGEKLCRLSVAGLINAMSGIEGGVVDATCSSSLSAEEDVMALTSHSLGDIRETASLIHETIVSCACLDKDQSSLSAEKQQSYKPIIYPDSSEDENSSSIRRRVRSSKKTSICKVCDNTKEYLLVFDTKKGGLICTSCGGTIACEDDNRMIHQKKKQKYSHYQTGGVFNHNGAHNKTSIYQQ